MLLKRGYNMRIATEKIKRELLELFGYRGLMPEPDYTGCHTQNLWEKILKSDIQLNRKVLADLAMNHPESFKKIVEKN